MDHGFWLCLSFGLVHIRDATTKNLSEYLHVHITGIDDVWNSPGFVRLKRLFSETSFPLFVTTDRRKRVVLLVCRETALLLTPESASH